jgi:hypothetical protein
MPDTTGTPAAERPLSISIRLLFAFEIGRAVDLARAASRLAATASRAPAASEPAPPPLRIAEPPGGLAVQGRPIDRVEAAIFDFGAVSIAYDLPFRGPLAELRRFSAGLAAGDAPAEDARRRAAALLSRLGDAVDRPDLAAESEDYLVFVADPADLPEGGPLAALDPEALAGALRGEAGPLSEEQVRDALAERLRYAPQDLVAIDWNAALLVDAEPAATLAVLEFLNVQLLEMRFLDGRLDRVLAEAYEALRRGGPPGRGWRWSQTARDWRRLAVLQMDAALLYESVSNALKLVGDQHLAKVFAATTRRFHLPDWERSILRKIEVLESMQGRLVAHQAAQRIEILEWIIIALIAFEIVFGLLPSLWSWLAG